MIITGVRPINVHNLRWDYVHEETGEIVYPEGVIGMRGAMKTQKGFPPANNAGDPADYRRAESMA